jgi:putative thioredoxin
MSRKPANAAEVLAQKGGAEGGAASATISGEGSLFASAEITVDQNEERMAAASQYFAKDVVEASFSVPVIVLFEGPWSASSNLLSPILEKAVQAAGGRVKLVKIDINQNRSLVQHLIQFGLSIQSVPMVVAYRQGQITHLFHGALSKTEVKRFVEGLVTAGSSMRRADLLPEIGVEDELAAREIDNILSRLDSGIEREKMAMDALLSRLRTTLIAA